MLDTKPDGKFEPIPVDDTVETLPEDVPEPKPLKKKKQTDDLVPGASVARPRVPVDRSNIALKPIQVDLFDLSLTDHRVKYQEILNKIDTGNAFRSAKTQLMACPAEGKWMILLHWREIDWKKTEAMMVK